MPGEKVLDVSHQGNDRGYKWDVRLAIINLEQTPYGGITDEEVKVIT